MAFWVYILKCNDGSLYTGSTKNLAKRIAFHNSGKGAKYTRGRLPVKLVYKEKQNTWNECLKREWEIKKYPRIKKLLLIDGLKKEM